MAIYTASQAQSAVISYDAEQAALQQNELVAQYQWIFDKIQLAASKGTNRVDIIITRADYAAVGSLLTEIAGYTFTVLDTKTSSFPLDGVDSKDNVRRYNVRLTWPSTASISYPAITNINPQSFTGRSTVPLAVKFIVDGGVAPYNFAVSGPIPAGCTLSDTTSVEYLTISGTPTTNVDEYEMLTIIATDSIGQTYTTYITYNISQGTPINVVTNSPGINALSYDNVSTFTFTPYALPTATTSILGGVKVDGTSITITNGVITAPYSYTLPSATTSVLGGVIVPTAATSGINNSSGTISLAQATTTQLGGVKVDGTTITASSGIISASSSYIDSRSRNIAVAMSIALY